MNKSEYHHLYDRRWRKRRERQLRAHPLCRLCFDVRGVVTQATVADHIEPHRGDSEKFKGALQSLCEQCHNGWKKQMENRGKIKGCDLRGMPLDPAHHWNKGRT